jgi:hypothetical protein
MEVFNLYQLKLNECVQNDNSTSIDQHTIISRVLEIIQSLPSIARSTRESDLRMNMKLISGYITVICRMKISTKRGGKVSHDYLLRKMMKNPYKQCLVGEF